MKRIANDIESAYTQFEKQLSSFSSRKSAQMTVVLTYCKAMMGIDWYLNDCSKNQAVQFTILYEKYRESSFDLSELKNAFEKQQTVIIENEMKRFGEMMKLSKKQKLSEADKILEIYNKAQVLFIEAMKSMEREALHALSQLEQQINDPLNTEVMPSLAETMNLMKELATCRDRYLCGDYWKIANQCEENTFSRLTQLMKNMEKSGLAAVGANNFVLVEAELSKFKQLNRLLTKDSQFGDKLNHELRLQLMKIKCRFTTLKILNDSNNPYNTDENSPKKLYESLKPVIKIQKYTKLWGVVKDAIIKKFEERLDFCDSKNSYEEIDKIMKQLEIVLKSLPENIINNLQTKYNVSMERLEKKRFQNNMRKYIENRSFNKINELYFESIKSGDKNRVKEFETYTRLELDNLKDRMKELLSEVFDNKCQIETVRKGVRDGWTVFVKLCQFVANFGLNNDEDNKRAVSKYDYLISNCRDFLIDYLRQRGQNISRYIETTPLSQDILQRLNRESSIVAVLSLKTKAAQDLMSDDDVCYEIMKNILEEVQITTEKTFEQCSEYFKKIKTKFENGLQLLDAQLLQDSLDAMNSFDRNKCLLLQNMIDFGNKIDEKEYLMEFPVMCDKLNKRLRDAMSELTERGIGDKNTLLFVESSNDFYKDIKYTLRQLQDCDKKLSKYLREDDSEKGHYFDICLKRLKKDVKEMYIKCVPLINEWQIANSIAKQELILKDVHLYYWQLVCIDKLSVIREFDREKDEIAVLSKDIGIYIQVALSEIVELFKTTCKKNSFTTMDARNRECLVKCLIMLEMARTMFEEFSDKIHNDMTSCLDCFQTQHKQQREQSVVTALTDLVNALEGEGSHWGAIVCASHQAFKIIEIHRFNSIFNENMNKQYISRPIDSVVQRFVELNNNNSNSETNVNQIEKHAMIDYYKKYEMKYNKLINKYIEPKAKLADLISNCTLKASNAMKQARKSARKEEKINQDELEIERRVEKKIAKTFDVKAIKSAATFIKDIKDKAVSSFVRSSQEDNVRAWDGFHDCVVELVAHIAAIWTLENCKEYIGVLNKHNCDGYLMKPRPSQIVSILILLSIDQGESKFVNNLIEIGTGEGKSVTLGITACVLGLLGYDVHCVCYSKYLSERDYGDFETIFKLLSIGSRIHYGTFNQLCEDIIISEGNVRELIENSILRTDLNDFKTDAPISTPPKILLIDEVDVFFSEKFYGNVYTPGAVIRHQSITQLIDLIWNNYSETDKKCKLTFYQIKQTREYGFVKDKIGKKWMRLIDEAIKQMLADIDTFESCDEYEIINDKIGYKDNDGINTSVTIGYKTLFTYYKENKNKQISDSSLNSKIGIYLQSGSFSYGDIVQHHFGVKIGVSGTLNTLSQLEINVIKNDYNIRRFTTMPSLFGELKSVFNQEHGVIICDEDCGNVGDEKMDQRIMDLNECGSNFYSAIMNEIGRGQASLKGTANGGNNLRPVFIVFEDSNELETFYNHSCFRKEKFNALVITEKTSRDERHLNVRLATTAGKITLFTREFGRGTDFQVRDKSVDTMGGPHIIQTFLSLESSEEKQIRGRTARQGGNGTYVMVLPASQLDKIRVTMDEAKTKLNQGKLYQYLNKKRNKLFEQRYKDNKRFVNDALTRHETALKLQRCLVFREMNEAMKILMDESRGPALARQKLPILVDATHSMSDLLLKTKNVMSDVFERCGKILSDMRYDPKCFEMCFIGYRNYSAPPDKIVTYSGWCNDPAQLRGFLSRVKPQWGWGREAIEIGLEFAKKQHIATQYEFEQMIIIGDSGANKIHEVLSKRKTSRFKWMKLMILKHQFIGRMN